MDKNLSKKEVRIKALDRFYQIIITELICGIVLILLLASVKLFFKGTYKELRMWYKENILSDTKISEIFEDDL